MSSYQINDEFRAIYNTSGLSFEQYRMVNKKDSEPALDWAFAGCYPSKAWLKRVVKQYERYAANKRITQSMAWTTENGAETLVKIRKILDSLPDNFDTEVLPKMVSEHETALKVKAAQAVKTRLNKKEGK